MKIIARNRVVSLLSFGALALSIGILASNAHADDQANAGRTILQQRCYKCHGDGGHFSGKFNLDDSVQTLVDKGILVYGDPEHSLLYQKVRDQDMPADGNYLNASELGLVSTWIQSLKPADQAPTTDASVMNDDQVVDTIKKFLSSSNEGGNYRIFSLVDLARQGKGNDELQIYRQALAKTINTLSLKKALVKPVAIDPGHLLLAVNIKDLGWDPQIWTADFAQVGCGEISSRIDFFTRFHEIDSDSYETLDNFNATLKKALSSCKTGDTSFLSSDESELLRDDSNSRNATRRDDINFCDNIAIESAVSFSVVERKYQDLDLNDCSVMPVDAFIVLGTRQQTYNDLVIAQLTGNRGNTIDGLLKSGFNQSNRGFDSLGLQSSGVALHNRVILRKKDFPGYFWSSRDFASDLDKDDLSRHPNAHQDAGEFIFSLPNGMQGYLLADSGDNLIAQAQTAIAVNPIRIDQIVSRPDSCIQCHGNIGIIPKGSSEVMPHGFSDFNDVKPFFTTDSNNYQAALKQIEAYRTDSIEPITYVLKNILSHDYK